jgi:hypothetical protein
MCLPKYLGQVVPYCVESQAKQPRDLGVAHSAHNEFRHRTLTNAEPEIIAELDKTVINRRWKQLANALSKGDHWEYAVQRIQLVVSEAAAAARYAKHGNAVICCP